MEFSDQPKVSTLSLDHMAGPLLLLIFGLSISLGTFLVEDIIFLFHHKINITIDIKVSSHKRNMKR